MVIQRINGTRIYLLQSKIARYVIVWLYVCATHYFVQFIRDITPCCMLLYFILT